MKLKYYLRGMGIGIILTAIVMGFALGGRKATLSDAEVIQRAKALGMVDGDSGVLLNSQGEEVEENSDDKTSSNTPLFEEGTTLPEKEQQEVADAGSSVSEMAKEEEEGEGSGSEASKDDSSAAESSKKEETVAQSEVSSGASTEASTGKSDVTAASTEASKTETAKTETPKTETPKTETQETPAQTASTSSGTGVNSTSKTITIPGGLGSDQVAQILYREGIIDNAVAFNKYLVDSRKDRIIRSGTKTIPAGASYDQIASIITQ
ncbi:hypothetical protein D6855_03290 [Butyrivibrio sp. CB08]|uniref:hypothetical protein n=1 Tax=Butyrivibrio sp. CB08 TaxID=2364879 RepID=UPI000EA8B32B|nr:hypothetical protein [Butyrivibrio sp. CB08]RKM62450.1 hypothetical protein D6855_03290 [Butyrivibrio sp. CB08]